MCNVRMIRPEAGLVSIPVERAVYCENCLEVSNSGWMRCGLCGSERIVELSTVFIRPTDPDLPPCAAAEIHSLAA
jgi:hypothetical protein